MSQNKTSNEITCEFVLEAAQKLGLKLSVSDKSWTVFEDQATKHKLCVSKTKGDAPKIDTTVDITGLEGVQARGVDAPANGRFVSLFSASAPLIEAALQAMAAPDAAPLRAVKRAAKRAPVAFQLPGTEGAPSAEGSGPGSAGIHMLSGLEA